MAPRAVRRATGRAAACIATASTSLPEYTGSIRSADVAPIMQSATHTTSHFSLRQWRKRNTSTSRIVLLLKLLLISISPVNQKPRRKAGRLMEFEEKQQRLEPALSCAEDLPVRTGEGV